MKFLIFSDLHRNIGSFDGGTYEDLRFFEKRALEEGCDFIIHAGDLHHGPTYKDNGEFTEFYNNLRVPTYHCLGNHDADRTPYEEVLRRYKMEEYYFIDGDTARLIVLNPNYFEKDGEYFHYSNGNYYYENRNHLPEEQLLWLEKTIESSTKPCILLSHESFERPVNAVKNSAAVREVLQKANARRKNSVVLCINGDSHKDHLRELDGIWYWEVNSASFEILEHRHKHYPKELCERYKDIDATLVIEDPLCAVVTVGEHFIDIKGMKSSFLLGVTKDQTEDPYTDEAGREATAEILDRYITF